MAVTMAPVLVQGNRVGVAPSTITFQQAPPLTSPTHTKAALVLQLIATVAVTAIATVAIVRLVTEQPEPRRRETRARH